LVGPQGNEWFVEGFNYTISKRINDIDVTILSLPYFLATKFSAFYDRGLAEPRISKDFEDIVYLMNYTSDLKDQILQAEEPVKYYLRKVFLHVLEDKLLQEAIIANLFYEQQIPRYNKIMAILKEICAQP
jgi:predicted nucleotidyltransferase